MATRALRIATLIATSLIISSCGDDTVACPIGAETCACTGGGSCDQGLTCASGLCVTIEEDAGRSRPDAALDGSTQEDATAFEDTSESADIAQDVSEPGDTDAGEDGIDDASQDDATTDTRDTSANDAATSLAQGESCTLDEECESGFCTDGVCCETRCEGECGVCSAAGGSEDNGRCTISESGTACTRGVCDGTGVECVEWCTDAYLEPERAPLDVIVVVSNSASMTDEQAALEPALYPSLIEPLVDAGADPQTILLTNYGTGITAFCPGAPLGDGDCSDAPPADDPLLSVYDYQVFGQELLCAVLDTINPGRGSLTADEWSYFPRGWESALRPDARQAFVLVTDNRVACDIDNAPTGRLDESSTDPQEVVLDFAERLDARSDLFGPASDANYRAYTVIGVERAEPGDPASPHLPGDDITSFSCFTASDESPAMQWLARGTLGLRFSVCEYRSYAEILQRIADDAADFAQTCSYPLVVEGGVLDSTTLTLTIESLAEPIVLDRVADAESCTETGYYLEGDAAVMCPTPCETLGGSIESGSADLRVRGLCD